MGRLLRADRSRRYRHDDSGRSERRDVRHGSKRHLESRSRISKTESEIQPSRKKSTKHASSGAGSKHDTSKPQKRHSSSAGAFQKSVGGRLSKAKGGPSRTDQLICDVTSRHHRRSFTGGSRRSSMYRHSLPESTSELIVRGQASFNRQRRRVQVGSTNEGEPLSKRRRNMKLIRPCRPSSTTPYLPTSTSETLTSCSLVTGVPRKPHLPPESRRRYTPSTLMFVLAVMSASLVAFVVAFSASEFLFTKYGVQMEKVGERMTIAPPRIDVREPGGHHVTVTPNAASTAAISKTRLFDVIEAVTEDEDRWQ